MEDRLYEMWLCHQHEQEPHPYQYKEFVCVTDFKNIEPILDHYSKLWQKIVEPRFTDYRSSSPFMGFRFWKIFTRRFFI